MIVTDKLGFIAHPNTGTRSIREALEKVGGREEGGYHEISHDHLGMVVACTVRNPFDLMVSWFLRTTEGKGRPFREWLPMTLDGLRHYEGPGNGLFYGYDYSDHIMRFESLQKDFDNVMDYVGHPRIELGHIGKTKRQSDYRDFYPDGDTIKLIEYHYGVQIGMGGYAF